RFTEDIGVLPIVVTKSKLGEVERQVFLADMMELSHDAALQNRPKRLDVVGMNLATYILAFAVRYCLMPQAAPLQEPIARMFVRRDQTNILADCLAHKAIKRDRIGVLDNPANYISLAANRADHSNLTALLATRDMRLFVRVAVLVLATDEGFIYL